MIPNHKDRQVTTGGVQASAEFGISAADTSHIMGILRDTLYSDKVLAVLREYSSNAWDAHREIGKKDLPIKVVLPTVSDPTLIIRDFGPGLSQEGVFEVYTQYGRSTKRGTDEAVGMLGIGSKSGFAYADSFTITSWHGGMKRVYVALLDKTEKGVINQLHEEPCGDETGLQIKIAVQPKDVWEFHEKAKSLFCYFIPRPDINLALEAEEGEPLVHGRVLKARGDWIAVMGCVPYVIDLSQVESHEGTKKLWEAIHRLSGALFFRIGEIHVNASREGLKYSETTRAALVEKFEALVDEFIQHTLNCLFDTSNKLTDWERRLRSQILHELKMPVPAQYKDMVSESASLEEKLPPHKDGDPPPPPPTPPTFYIHHGGTRVWRLPVSESTQLWIRDDGRHLAGYRMSGNDFLVLPNGNATTEQVKADLEKLLRASRAYGVPVKRLTERPWFPVIKNEKQRTYNQKHRVATFRLITTTKKFADKYSENWEIQKRVPTDDDVFVILEHFEATVGGKNFYSVYRDDRKLLEILDGPPLPVVYGYKSTPKKPVLEKDCKGRHYREWRKDVFRKIASEPSIRKVIQDSHWADLPTLSEGDEDSYATRPMSLLTLYDVLQARLGRSHLVSSVLRRSLEASAANEALPEGRLEAIKCLVSYLDPYNVPKIAVGKIFKTYPILDLPGEGIGSLACHKKHEPFLEYIQLVDDRNHRLKGKP